MYVLIEHSGKESHNEAANEIQEYLESEFGATCEQVIAAQDSPIVLYDKDLKEIAKFTSKPDHELLRLYMILQEEED